MVKVTAVFWVPEGHLDDFHDTLRNWCLTHDADATVGVGGPQCSECGREMRYDNVFGAHLCEHGEDAVPDS